MSDNLFGRSKTDKEDLLKLPFDNNQSDQHNNQSFSSSLSFSDSNSHPRMSFGFGQKRPAVHGKQMENSIDPESPQKNVKIFLSQQTHSDEKPIVLETKNFQVPNGPKFELSMTSPIERMRKSSFHQFLDSSESSQRQDSYQNSANIVENDSLNLEDIEEKSEGAKTPKFYLDERQLIIKNYLDSEKKPQRSPNQMQESPQKEQLTVTFGKKSEDQRQTMRRKPKYIELEKFDIHEQSEKKEIPKAPDQKHNYARKELICYGCGGNHYFDQCPSRRDSFQPIKTKCFNCKKQGHVANNCPEPRRCNNCGSIDHIARDCPSEETSRRYKICNNCHEPGHFLQDCTKPKKCFLCHQVGHEIKNCPKNKKNKTESNHEKISKPNACFNCKKSGHYAADCTEPEKCHKCGSESHFSRHCPRLATRSRSVEGDMKQEEKVERKESLEKPTSEPEPRRIQLFTNLNFRRKSKNGSKPTSSKGKQNSKDSKIGNQRLKDLRK